MCAVGGGRGGRGGAQIMPGNSAGVIRGNKLSAWAWDGPYCSYLDGEQWRGVRRLQPIIC